MKKMIFLLTKLGYVCLIGFSITALMTFVMAFLNGGKITVYLNNAGEMYAEIIILILLFPSVVLAVVDVFKNVKV